MTSTKLILPAAEAGQVQVGDITVNRIGYGAMRITGDGVWGPPENIDLCKQVIKRAAELGVNFFDTADSYGPNISEELLHDTLYPYKGMLIATKGGMTRIGPHEWTSNASREHLQAACQGSMQRLELKQLPLYQLHRPDSSVSFEKSVRAMLELKQQGKIANIGLSNVSLRQLKAALTVTPVATVQNHYNVMYRKESEAIVEFCEQNDIVFIPYFPMGGGVSDLSRPEIQQVAQKYDASTSQIALAWLLARSPAILPIPGTASIEHLEENVAAAAIKLDASDMRLLDQLSD